MKNELIQNYFYNKAISENKPVGVMIELLTKWEPIWRHSNAVKASAFTA